MKWQAKWIRPASDMKDVCPVFCRAFTITKPVASATLHITAMGVYEAILNGERVGTYILAPGWTAYNKRLQYQEYDVTSDICAKNKLCVMVGRGWFRSRMPGWMTPHASLLEMQGKPAALLAQVTVYYTDGTAETFGTDNSWLTEEGPVRYSEIYDGEVCDATVCPTGAGQPAEVFGGYTGALIPQQGEIICEQERVAAVSIFTTTVGEYVVDFGQEITGYVETALSAAAGEKVSLSFAEVLDKDGNFYTANYRSAKCRYEYTCTDGEQAYKPHFTFYGFRYLRIDAFPGGPAEAQPENFTAIVVHSKLQRTGWLRCSNPLLNRLFDNIAWGQKGNFLDVPTDCPQRDERLGWTGDAQAFIKTACFQYDVEKFFTKWLADMTASQGFDGRIPHVVPDWLPDEGGSAAWGDAATICPWELYLAYGNPQILERQFDTMTRWVDYVTGATKDEHLWTGHTHFGDWLGLDAPSGSYKGSSREDFIASAFYAWSTALVIKAGKAIGRNIAEYERLHAAIVKKFRQTYPEYKTQTECVLAAHFGLAENPKVAADQLAEMVKKAGVQLQTGFVGTPYLMHVLSNYGHIRLAYDLLLREQYPSWLYPVTKGATTVWEHWDGIMADGGFWSADMNSYNHYAYGAVADWAYNVAAGICPTEDAPGYRRVTIAPHPDVRLDWLESTYVSRYGPIRSHWQKQDDMWRYEIDTAVPARIVIAGKTHKVEKGSYLFYSDIEVD